MQDRKTQISKFNTTWKWHFKTYYKCFWDFEIRPKFSKTLFFRRTILYGPYNRLCASCLICFCLPFRFYCRLYIYPIKVLYSCGFDCRLYVPTAPFYFFFNTMLWILFAMNVWWFQYIVWLLIRIVTGMSRSVEDTREIPKRRTVNGPKMVENEDMSNGSGKNHG